MVRVRQSYNLFRYTSSCLSYKFRASFIDKAHRMSKSKVADRTDDSTSNKKVEDESIAEINPHPDFIAHRQRLWDEFKKAYEEDLQSKVPAEITINAKDKDNKIRSGLKYQSWVTLPINIAKEIGTKSWCESLVISKVNGVLWDLERPLEEDCDIEYLTFDDKEGMYCAYGR